jgi:hypothetical protein
VFCMMWIYWQWSGLWEDGQVQGISITGLHSEKDRILNIPVCLKN